MKQLTFKIKGLSPMLMHNGNLANPFNKYAREMKRISSKRKKTDEDMNDLALLEARGGLYFNESEGVHVPGENIEATLVSGAKLSKLGSTLKRALQVVDINCPLVYKGPKNPEDLVKDERFLFQKMVKVGTSKVLRTRPIFEDWALEFTVMFDESQLDDRTIEDIVHTSGRLIGLGDWRPRYGKFEVTEVN